MLQLDSTSYNAYHQGAIPLEIVADYAMIKNLPLRDAPELIAFAGPKMEDFYRDMMRKVARQRETIEKRNQQRPEIPSSELQTLWERELPQRFTDELKNRLATAQKNIAQNTISGR